MQAHHVMDHYGIVFKFQKMRFCVYTAFIDEDAMPSTYILSIHTCWGSGNVSETHIYRHHTYITCTIGRHTCVDTCVFSWPYITCILFNMEWSRYTLMKVPKMTPKYREPVAQHSPRFAITKNYRCSHQLLGTADCCDMPSVERTRYKHFSAEDDEGI